MSEEVICDITPPNSPFDYSSLNDEEFLPSGNILKFRWFSCIGEAKLEKVEVSEDGYLKNFETALFEENVFLPSYTLEQKNINLFDDIFDFGSVFLEDSSLLFRMARSEIIYLQDATKLNQTNLFTYSDLQLTQNHMKARSHLVNMFLYLREYLHETSLSNHKQVLSKIVPIIEENLSWFRLFLRRITDLPEYVLHHAARTQGNKCLEASYHLFHGVLDMMWLHLSTLYQVNKCRRQIEEGLSASQQSDSSPAAGRGVLLEQSVVALIADLIQLAVIRFEKIDVRSLLIKSPFNCQCVAELWTLLHVFTNKLNSIGVLEKFWTIVSKVLEELFTSKDHLQLPTNCVTLTMSVTHPCHNSYIFALWLMKHLAMLQSFDDKITSSNYHLLEIVVKGFLTPDVPEINMRVYLTLIEKILIKYWEPKSDIIILLWEHFQKRLNSTFFVPGSSVESMAMMSESVSGMVKQVKARLLNQVHCEDSFQMFLRIAGLHLQRLSSQGQHWKQIRGRIYSKLSATKVQSLNEVGIYHLSSLFLTLAITADLSEVGKKLQGLLCYLSEADMEVSMKRLVWRSQLSICMLFAERCLDFTPFITPLTSALSNNDITLFRTYVEGVRDILETCPTARIDHSALIGDWIVQYLADCSPNDASRLLEMLQMMILRVQKQPFDHSEFQKRLWQLLASYFRQKMCEDSPLQLADFSLNLCLLSQACSDTLRDILHLFINNSAANIGLVRRFLSQLVQHKDLLSIMNKRSAGSPDSCEVLIVKGWIHCSLVSLDCKSSELCKVTEHIAYLPFVADVCMDLPSATDPLKHFIVAVSNKFKTAKDLFERSSLRKRMSCYFTGLSKWVEPYIRQTKCADIIRRVYHIVGLIVSLMPSFIYVKSNPTTVLKGLLDIMFLPMKAYKPDYEPSPYVRAAITADLHLYVKGLAELVIMHDTYIERSIEDLVRIYLPWVVGGSRCNLHECVEKTGKAARLILSATCSAFLRRKASSPHPHCSQALKFLKQIVLTYSRDARVIVQLTDCCFEHLCDIIMFCEEIHPSKNNARDVVVSIFECHSFSNDLCDKIIEKMESLCQEYLPFMPGKLFNLLHEVVNHRPELVSRFLPSLQNHIKRVETKRGISYDQSLRAYKEKLEKTLERLRNGL